MTLYKNSSGLTRALTTLQQTLEKTPPAISAVPRLEYHEGQKEIAEGTAKYKVVACGRQFGKTEYGIDEVIGTALDGYPVAYFAQTYDASVEAWETLKDLLLPITLRKSESRKMIRLTTGGVVRIWSHGNVGVKSLRGQKYKKVIVDEAALASMETWTKVIWPTLSAYDGDALFLSTPRGKRNWFYEIFKWGVEGRDGWQSFQMPTERNPYIPKSYLKRVKAQMSEDEYGQEHEAKFTIVAGAVYPTFREATSDGTPGNVTMEADYHSDYPVYWSCDDGYTNPRVIGLWQYRPLFGIEGCYCLFDYVYETQELAAESIERLLDVKRDDANNIMSVGAAKYTLPEWAYYDPSAAEFGGVLQSYGLATWGAYNGVSEGIKVVRRFILDGNGVRRLFIHPRCRPIIDEMMAYRNPEGDRIASKGGDPNPEKKNDHGPDMIRYLIATRHLHD